MIVSISRLNPALQKGLMYYPNTWVAELLGVNARTICAWRGRHGFKPATTQGGPPIPGKDDFWAKFAPLIAEVALARPDGEESEGCPTHRDIPHIGCPSCPFEDDE